MPLNKENLRDPKLFWEWVAGHLGELRLNANDPDSETMETMADKLNQYDPSLGIEVSVSDAGDLEVVITAYGERGSFGSVRHIVDACPPTPGLKAIAFRQPEGADFNLNVGDQVFLPKRVWFEPMKGRADPKSIGLMIFFPDADDIPVEQRLHIAQVMLQAILGEYECALRLDHVEVANSAGIDLGQYIPLADVAAYISWFDKRNPRAQQ